MIDTNCTEQERLEFEKVAWDFIPREVSFDSEFGRYVPDTEFRQYPSVYRESANCVTAMLHGWLTSHRARDAEVSDGK